MPPMSSAPFRQDYGHFFGASGFFRYPTSLEAFLAKFFYADLRVPALQPVAFTDFKSYKSFVRNLRTIIEIASCEGIPLILSNQAHRFSVTADGGPEIDTYLRSFLLDCEHYADERSWYGGMELINAAAMNLARDTGIPFVDQALFFRGKKDLFVDPWHMVAKGRALKAQRFFEKIIELKLIENYFLQGRRTVKKRGR